MSKLFKLGCGRKCVLLLSITAISFLFSLCLAEIFLRISSILVRKMQTHSYMSSHWESPRKSKETVNILALGDSYTFGGFGKNHDTYPSELVRLFLKENTTPVSIMNQGVCEYTSRQILEPLSSTLTFSHADIVLLLIGSADLFDPYQFSGELSSVSEKLGSWGQRLMVYKVYRYLYNKAEVAYYEYGARKKIYYNEKVNDILKKIDQVSPEVLRQSPRELNEKFSKYAASDARKMRLEEKINYSLNAYLRGEYKIFFKNIEPIIDEMYVRGDEKEQCDLQLRLNNFLREAQEFEDKNNISVSVREKLVKHIHSIKLGLYRCAARGSYWKILRAVVYNQIDAKEVLEAFQYAVKRYPYLMYDERTISALLALKNQKIWREKVAIWYEENMRKIIDIAKKKDVILVMQTYPIPYAPINEVVRRLSSEYQLPLVDHEKIFAPLIAKSRQEYILNDLHCTDKGHQLMARNVHKLLSEKILLDKNKLKALIEHGGF